MVRSGWRRSSWWSNWSFWRIPCLPTLQMHRQGSARKQNDFKKDYKATCPVSVWLKLSNFVGFVCLCVWITIYIRYACFLLLFFHFVVVFFPLLSIFRSQSQNVELDISKLKCVQSHPVPKVPTDISDNFHANVNDVIINDDFHANVNNVIYQWWFLCQVVHNIHNRPK